MNTCTTCGAEWPDDTKFCPNDGSTLRRVGGADLVGSVIADRYHIEQKLGEGGMGAVYLGEHVKMRRKSAIKVMTQSMANDPEAMARFNREAANAARINHANVCAIYDFGETEDGLIYLAMEFIEGEALSDLMRRQGALPFDRAANILQQTAEALQAAHDLGIVHRDLKPDNIMITKGRAGADLVKVVDFGIAKAMGGEEGQKVTKTGLVVGTPEYMSPEQLSGDVLDGRSDIYSLALVFFRMLTGTLPFQADSAQETMIKRLTDDPLKLGDVLPDSDFPPRLQGVLDRALRRMPADRYDSAQLFGRHVMDAVSGVAAAAPAGVDTEGATQLIDTSATERLTPTRVSGAREPTTPETPVPPVTVPAPPRKKKPAVAIAAAIGALVLAGGATAVVMQVGREGESRPMAEDTSQAGRVAGGSGVTNDTAGQRGGDDSRGELADRQRRPRRETDDAPATRDTGQIPPAVVDVAAIRQELLELQRQVDEDATRLVARQRLVTIYGMGVLPSELRGRAAAIVADSYDQVGRSVDACTWIADAVRLDPTNSTHRQVQTVLYGCTS